MCGIAGIVSPHGCDAVLLRSMSHAIRHRGPDDEGYWVHDNTGRNIHRGGKDTLTDLPPLESQEMRAGLAHRRLSVIDTSPRGHQPMAISDGKFVISFNGELYNYIELRRTLEKHDVKFETDSDTEVFLKSYRQWGEACFERFRGMWACAIADTSRRSVLICRDRYGIKPLYLTRSDKGWAFASEIKAFIAAGLYRPRIDEYQAISFIAHGTISEPYSTVFSGVSELEPGTWKRFSWEDENVKSGSFYHLDKDSKRLHPKQAGSLQAEFEDLFGQSIDLHLRSDVPVGSCLSGGLDSSAITAFAVDRLDEGRFKTFTASYPDHVLDESRFARAVTDHLGEQAEPYQVMPDSDGLWNDWERLVLAQELPFGSSSIYAQWCVMRAASEEGIKVLLDGQGADELLGGYYNYAGLWVVELAREGKYRLALQAYFELNKNFTSTMDMAVFRALYYQLPQWIAKKLRAWKRSGVGLLANDAKKVFQEAEVPDRGGKSFEELTKNSIRYNLNELLRYEDRNSMAFSVESRVPFLDHRLVNFVIAAPTAWKIRNGWTKHPLRMATREMLPREIVWRKDKLGFVTPQAIWKRQLSSRLEEWLHSVEMPSLLNREAVLKMAFEEQTSSARQSEFWRLISFLKWHELFLVQNSVS